MLRSVGNLGIILKLLKLTKLTKLTKLLNLLKLTNQKELTAIRYCCQLLIILNFEF